MEKLLVMVCDMYCTADQTLSPWPFWSHNLFQVHFRVVLSLLCLLLQEVKTTICGLLSIRVNYILYPWKSLSLALAYVAFRNILWESVGRENESGSILPSTWDTWTKKPKLRIVAMLVQIASQVWKTLHFQKHEIISPLLFKSTSEAVVELCISHCKHSGLFSVISQVLKQTAETLRSMHVWMYTYLNIYKRKRQNS